MHFRALANFKSAPSKNAFQNISSNINEVIREVISSLFIFFYEEILQQKRTFTNKQKYEKKAYKRTCA